MGRRKIEIKPIKDDRNRSVTFLKRKGGLFKKAHELSVLTSVEVAVIIFGQNNKLYEYSSSPLPEFLTRYNYARATYGGPHEQKTPDDFNRGGDGYDDDDDENIPDHRDSNSPPQHVMIPHLQQPQFQGMGTPSASPPMPNGAFHPHHATPQPVSRPSSRTHMRHPSQPLPPGPQQRLSGPPPPQYSYTPNPPIYNPGAAQPIPPRSQPPPPPPPQHFQYTSAPQAHHPPGQQQPSPQPMYQESRPLQMNPVPPSQPQRLEGIKVEISSPVDQPQGQFNSPPPQPKPLPASKTHSIFTPIEGSVFTKHWGSGGDSTPDQASARAGDKSPRSQSLDMNSLKRQANGTPNGAKSGPTSNPPLGPVRTASTPTLSSGPAIPNPSRSNSMANDPKRPRLKVQIPSGHSDDESGTAATGAPGSTSSPSDPSRTPLIPPHRGASKRLLTPIREPGTAGPVLPPPSPSAGGSSAYPLSAGATGPPNPFARPLPANAASSIPTSSGNNSSSNNAGNQSREKDLETPISALPSRFMNGDFLPSPSSFYNDWAFGRDSAGPNGVGNNMLPSPLTFQTPVNAQGPSFRDDGNHRATSQERERSRSGERDAGTKRKVDEIATPVMSEKEKLSVEVPKRIKT